MSSTGLSGARVAQTLVFCVACFVDHCLSFCNFHVVIVLSVLLRLTFLITSSVSSNCS